MKPSNTTAQAWSGLYESAAPSSRGVNLMGLAEVAERRDDHDEAVQLLDQAADLFQQHGAQLYLKQVLAKKDILKA